MIVIITYNNDLEHLNPTERMILAMNLDLIKIYYINKRATHWHRTQKAYCENQLNGAHLYLIIRNKGLLFHPAGRAQKRLLRNMILKEPHQI